MMKSLTRIGVALACLSATVAARVQAQQNAGRWMFEAGIAGAPASAADIDVFAGVARRIANTGPFEWSAGVTMYGMATVSRGDFVTVTPYCPGGCPGINDHSRMVLPGTAGITIRLVGLPWIFNRIIPQFGTGGYYARWANLPNWDADRAPVLTGYRRYAVGLRFTRHVGASAGVTDFRNVRHGYHKSSGWIALQVRFP